MARGHRNFLVEAFSTNIWSKVFAMVLALAIWGSAYSGMLATEELEYTAELVVPESYVLVSTLVEKGPGATQVFSGRIEVQIAGQRSVLPTKGEVIRIMVDPLGDGLIDLKDIRYYSLAGGLRVKSCQPELLRVEVQKLVRVTLPDFVGVSTTGELVAGLEQIRADVMPKQVVVEGPEKTLQANLNVLRVETEAIDISGLRELKLERKNVGVRLLGAVANQVRLITQTVDVSLSFESTVVKEPIDVIPVRYALIPKYFTVDGSRREAKIEIEGPPSAIKKFRADVAAGKYVLLVNAGLDLNASVEMFATLEDCHIVPALPQGLRLTDVPGAVSYWVSQNTKATSTTGAKGRKP